MRLRESSQRDRPYLESLNPYDEWNESPSTKRAMKARLQPVSAASVVLKPCLSVPLPQRPPQTLPAQAPSRCVGDGASYKCEGKTCSLLVWPAGPAVQACSTTPSNTVKERLIKTATRGKTRDAPRYCALALFPTARSANKLQGQAASALNAIIVMPALPPSFLP